MEPAGGDQSRCHPRLGKGAWAQDLRPVGEHCTCGTVLRSSLGSCGQDSVYSLQGQPTQFSSLISTEGRWLASPVVGFLSKHSVFLTRKSREVLNEEAAVKPALLGSLAVPLWRRPCYDFCNIRKTIKLEISLRATNVSYLHMTEPPTASTGISEDL